MTSTLPQALPENRQEFPSVSALVVAGNIVRGKTVNYPTANLDVTDHQKIIASWEDGMYAGWASLGDIPTRYVAVCSVGKNSHCQNTQSTLEVHLLEYTGGDFYGITLNLHLMSYFGPQKKYVNLKALVADIREWSNTATPLLPTTSSSCLPCDVGEVGNLGYRGLLKKEDGGDAAPRQLRNGFMAVLVHSTLLALPIPATLLVNALLIAHGLCALGEAISDPEHKDPVDPCPILHYSAACVSLSLHPGLALSSLQLSSLVGMGAVATVATTAIDYWIPRKMAWVRILSRVVGSLLVRRYAYPQEPVEATLTLVAIQASFLGAVSLARAIGGTGGVFLEYCDWFIVWLSIASNSSQAVKVSTFLQTAASS